jgi:hypothetical protein
VTKFSDFVEIFSKIFEGIWYISDKIFGKIYQNLRIAVEAY